jgi:hypothetical protein
MQSQGIAEDFSFTQSDNDTYGLGHDGDTRGDDSRGLSSGGHAAADDQLATETQADGTLTESRSEASAFTLVTDVSGDSGNSPASPWAGDGHLFAASSDEGLGSPYGLQTTVDLFTLIRDHGASVVAPPTFTFDNGLSITLFTAQPVGPNGALVVADLGITPGHNDSLLDAGVGATRILGSSASMGDVIRTIKRTALEGGLIAGQHSIRLAHVCQPHR